MKKVFVILAESGDYEAWGQSAIAVAATEDLAQKEVARLTELEKSFRPFQRAIKEFCKQWERDNPYRNFPMWQDRQTAYGKAVEAFKATLTDDERMLQRIGNGYGNSEAYSYEEIPFLT